MVVGGAVRVGDRFVADVVNVVVCVSLAVELNPHTPSSWEITYQGALDLAVVFVKLFATKASSKRCPPMFHTVLLMDVVLNWSMAIRLPKPISIPPTWSTPATVMLEPEMLNREEAVTLRRAPFRTDMPMAVPVDHRLSLSASLHATIWAVMFGSSSVIRVPTHSTTGSRAGAAPTLTVPPSTVKDDEPDTAIALPESAKSINAA